jgi:ribosomal protein S18 acetylase RimI-like enzyme
VRPIQRRRPSLVATWAGPYYGGVEIILLGPADADKVMAGGHLFDNQPIPDATARFLAEPGHHLLMALDDGEPVGFISGVETTHPDKGTEMFLYELSVDEAHRRQGVGTELVRRLAELARSRGCYGMWVGTEPANVAALATYQRGGGSPEEELTTVLTWDFQDVVPKAGA